MTMIVRQCMRCGRQDLRERWPSTDEALEAGAMSSPWTCPSCAWTEADLVASTGATSTASEAGASERRDLGGTGDADNAPASAEEEARRAVDASLPFRGPHV